MPGLSKNLKLIAAGAVASVFLSSPAAATVVDTALWTTLSSPGLQFNAGGSDTVTNSGTSVSVVGNRQSTVVSNFSQSGDFVFSGRMRATNSDNDNMGVTFGFSDLSNHYRLGWEGGGFGDIGSGGLGASGANGLFLVVEQGGTGSVLFQNATLNWATGTDYDFTVSRTGKRYLVHDPAGPDGCRIPDRGPIPHSSAVRSASIRKVSPPIFPISPIRIFPWSRCRSRTRCSCSGSRLPGWGLPAGEYADLRSAGFRGTIAAAPVFSGAVRRFRPAGSIE